MGIGLAAYSMAPSIYGFIFTMIVNPFDYSPKGDPKYFDYRVSDEVPSSIRYLSLIILAVGILGPLMMGRKKNINLDSTSSHNLSLKQVLLQGKFWYLF